VPVGVEVDDGLAMTGVGQDESPRESRREPVAGIGRGLVAVAVVQAPDCDRHDRTGLGDLGRDGAGGHFLGIGVGIFWVPLVY
jgi:hypothetical protein